MACGSTQLGCQTMGPVPSCGLISQQETKPTQATSLAAARVDESSPAQALATDAIVRGQSPDQNYNRYTQPPATNGYVIPQSTPGSNDYFRGPMNPSGAAVPTLGGPPNVQPGIAGPQPTTAYQMPTGTAPYGAPATSPYGPGGMSPATDAPFIPNAPMQPYVPSGSTAPPIDQAWAFPSSSFPASPSTGYQPPVRSAPIDVYLQEAQTGRIVFGGSVNTDLGVAGQIVVEERNFDITRTPRSFGDLFNGAFRGNGENFRLELMPGNRVQRYSVNWTQPNLFGYSPWSLSLGGYLFTRIYRDWQEQRLGARGMLGYQITPDLSFSTELRGEDVKIKDPRVNTLAALNEVVGSNDLYTSRFRLAHNTRDSPFLPTEGHFLELIYDQVFGSYDFPRGQINYSKYFLIRERADGGGRHTLTSSWKFGFSGTDTPIFENYFAGGYTTMRGFAFRGASPVENDVQIGGRFMFLGSLEYMFPLTADDMLRMVAFCDYGTIEKNIEMHSDNFRVAPGLGLRVAIPALGPGPLAFDFAYPVMAADTDTKQVFSFSVGLTR
ncbi:MAG: BamA/TamA family outer membrane protein [Pirellulales bacterium]